MQGNPSVHSDKKKTCKSYCSVFTLSPPSLLHHHVRVALGSSWRGLDHAGGPVVVNLLALPHHALAGAVAGVAGAVVATSNPPTLMNPSWRLEWPRRGVLLTRRWCRLL